MDVDQLKTQLPVLISSLSLLISLVTAWLNLRRGKVKATRPRRILLFEKAIYIDMLLTTSASRGRILEEMIVVLEDETSTYRLREWVHHRVGDKAYLERASIFVPYTGYAATHQWFFDKANTRHRYAPGRYSLEVLNVSGMNPIGRRMFKVEFELTRAHIEAAFVPPPKPIADDDRGKIEIDWDFFAGGYEVMAFPWAEEE